MNVIRLSLYIEYSDYEKKVRNFNSKLHGDVEIWAWNAQHRKIERGNLSERKKDENPRKYRERMQMSPREYITYAPECNVCAYIELT